MKVTAPISRVEEVEVLAATGADEFYCGVTPQEWVEQYGFALWMNRRDPRGANLPSLTALCDLINRSHQKRIPVYLTLNAPYYTEQQHGCAVKVAEEAALQLGVDGLIVADVALLRTLSRMTLPVHLHVSSLAVCASAETAAFLHQLGATRIILPRHLSASEIKQIVKSVPEVEYEVFLLNDGCAFEEGHCMTLHNLQGLNSFCITDWEYEFLSADGRVLSEEEEARLRQNLTDYREWLWYTGNCGCSMSLTRFPNGPCGLCAISEFAKIGVAALKVVGREADSFRKARSVRLARAVVDKLRSGASAKEVARFAQQLRSTPDLCPATYMCAYRKTAPRGCNAWSAMKP